MNLSVLKNFELMKSPDSEIREGAYSRIIAIFSDPENKATPDEKSRYLAELCSDRYLFYGIEAGVSDDSVARSFSILALAIIVESDKANAVDVEQMTAPLSKYIKLECDFRGKDNKLGWIHALAHLGDLLAFLALHKGMSKKSIEHLCLTIIEKVSSINEPPLNHGEDKRLAMGLFYALEASLGCNDSVFRSLDSGIRQNYPRKQNIENIVRCLYIELVCHAKDKALSEHVKRILDAS